MRGANPLISVHSPHKQVIHEIILDLYLCSGSSVLTKDRSRDWRQRYLSPGIALAGPDNDFSGLIGLSDVPHPDIYYGWHYNTHMHALTHTLNRAQDTQVCVFSVLPAMDRLTLKIWM